MVWFQCEDCGENLKKPKLPNHFRICSATKLSCIDCGVTFGQGSVQGHTQCITEAEKYGPKGRVKPANGTTSKSNKDAKQQPDVDINVGLSERPPWFCSLCNTKATSKQTLLLHADGKKHRAKAKAFLAVNAPKQESKQSEESAPDANPRADCSVKSELPASKHADEEKAQEVSKPNGMFTNSETENAQSSSKKKRKLDASGVDGTEKKTADDATDEVVYGVAKRRKADENFENGKHNDDKVTKPDGAQEDTKKKIKWKKLIKSALKSSPDGVLKIKKLKTLVVKSLQESSITGDEIQLSKMIEQKINSSSRFKVDGKCVHLVAKD